MHVFCTLTKLYFQLINKHDKSSSSDDDDDGSILHCSLAQLVSTVAQ